MQIFVTGTEKNTGKTAITTGLATVMQSLDYKAGVYKPIQTGAIEKNGFWVSPDLAYINRFFTNNISVNICFVQEGYL